MEKLAKNKGLAYKVMDSGAVHDACMIANFVDTGMIFVPSIDGRSHVPEENTNEKSSAETEDIESKGKTPSKTEKYNFNKNPG